MTDDANKLENASRKRANRLATISLSLCVLLVAFWILSIVHVDVVRWPANARESWVIAHSDGGFIVGRSFQSVTSFRFDGFTGDLPAREPVWFFILGDNPARGREVAGFGYVERLDPFTGRPTTWAYFAAYWPLMLLTSVYPIVWLVGWRSRHRRFNSGRCTRCGYDVRATPDRCPECGQMTTLSAPAGAVSSSH